MIMTGDRMKVIFQDVDGVLYPCFNRKALKQDAYRVKDMLVHKDSFFADAPAMDLLAVYEGWDAKAMQRLQFLIEDTGAKLVISSSWKIMRSLKTMQQLFAVYGLGQDVIALTPNDRGFLKEPAIQHYLSLHHEVEQYVILDDIDMSSTFPEHCVVCGDIFDDACLKKAITILNDEK